MASWKLIVENYGKIKSAEIEVAPLTLFVGDNNSGKSYLMSLLWGIEKYGVEALIGRKFSNTDDEKEIRKWIDEQIEIALDKKVCEVCLGEVSALIKKFLNDKLLINKNSLVRRIFNNKSVDIGNLEIQLEHLEDIIIRMEVDEMNHFEISGNGKATVSCSSKLLTKKKDSFERDFVIWIFILKIYSVILNIDMQEESLMYMGRSIYLPAARTGFMLTKDIINKVGRKNTFNLSEEKEDITPFINPINQFLDIMGDLSIEIIGKQKHLSIVSDIENEMTCGSVEISAMPNKEVQYTPIGYKKGIPLRLSSAVVTELSPLLLILKHHNSVQNFYYEEPEMCLHPQLQSKMGKVIGRMVNSGLGMVITTHSDIMLQHFNNMIKLAKRPDCQEICEQLGYTDLDLLKPEQVKIYQLRAKRREKTEVEELSCGEDGFVVPTFNDALDEIMNEAYEIQG